MCDASDQGLEISMLQRGDSVPHFEARTLEGVRINYSTIWQHKNLMLITIPAFVSPSAIAYTTAVRERLREFGDQDLECIITQDQIPGVPAPAVVVADRWGEVVFVAEASEAADLPAPQELVEWVNFVMNQCPECEAEAR